MSDAPATVTEAVELLVADGYTENFVLRDGAPCRRDGADLVPLADPAMERVYRFEGESDPGDEMIVIGVHCRATDRRGVVAAAYGPEADAATVAFLQGLLDDR